MNLRASACYAKPLCLVAMMFASLCCSVYGQSFHAKLHFGAMYYQGDLAPKPLDLSFGPGNLCWGVSTGYSITDWASINSRFMVGRLTGDDAYSDDPFRRSRNLNFGSPLYEYGIYTDLRINKIWKSLDKYKIRMYLTAGLNVIQFNPQAFYQGQWVELQPLGTEGQTIPGTGKQKYSLTSWSRPVGLIIEFDFTKMLSFGMEFTPRKTFTDYLDDVSGTYVNYDEMVAAGNPIGAALSNRMGEYLKTDNVRVPTGTARGRADKNDWYSHFGLYFKYKIGKVPLPVALPPDDSDFPPTLMEGNK
ncbi:MAG: hypothetical protein IPL08_01395 [Saprospiraceae bacterium]|nr:hypothetical protein [Saprospiraceae bacterium]